MSTALLAATPPAPAFRAGAATSNITPALGSAIIGGFLPFPATNVHDELHAQVPGARRWEDEAGAGGRRPAGHPLQREPRGAQVHRAGDGHPGDERVDLGHPQSFGRQRSGRNAFRVPAEDRQLSSLRRPPDRRRSEMRRQPAASGAARVHHRPGAGARIQPPLVPQAGHHAAQSVRRHRPGEDEPAGGQPEPGEAGRADRSHGVDPRRARARWPADRRVLVLFAALRGRRGTRRHFGRLLRHVLPAFGTSACMATSRIRRWWP